MRALAWSLVVLASGASAQPALTFEDGPAPVSVPDVARRPVVDTQASPARERTEVTPERAGEDPGPVVRRTMATRAELGAEALRRGIALQPSLRLGNVGGGLRKAWDAAEPYPPNALKVGRQWEPEAGASDLMRMGFGDLSDPELQIHWGKRGAAFYHDLPLIRSGHKWLRHRYVYYFLAGYDAWGGRLPPHVVWVEVRERLDPTEPERAQLVARARGELAEKIATLERLAAGGGPQAEPARQMLAQARALAEGEPPIPLHLQVDQVILADPMPVRGGQPWKIRVLEPDDLEWDGDRLVLYVAEGSHRFVTRPKDLGWFEECDAPWIREPHQDGRLPLVDLREPRQPENPIAARDGGAVVPPLPGFVDSPVLVAGFDGAYRMDPASFAEPPPEWVRAALAASPPPAASPQPER